MPTWVNTEKQLAGLLLAESGDFIITESGDFIIVFAGTEWSNNVTKTAQTWTDNVTKTAQTWTDRTKSP